MVIVNSTNEINALQFALLLFDSYTIILLSNFTQIKCPPPCCLLIIIICSLKNNNGRYTTMDCHDDGLNYFYHIELVAAAMLVALSHIPQLTLSISPVGESHDST